jgi:hypothetical protein
MSLDKFRSEFVKNVEERCSALSRVQTRLFCCNVIALGNKVEFCEFRGSGLDETVRMLEKGLCSCGHLLLAASGGRMSSL